MVDKFYNGRRLSYEGDLCTVRYVGPIQGTKGEWLGVEWDDPARGKHNGQHKGVEYFKCVSLDPHPASFVRQTRPHDSPCSFIEAVHNKYVSETPAKGSSKIDSQNEIITISGKEVEEVGFDKIRHQLANLRGLLIIVLDESRIGNQEGEIAQGVADTSPKVAELDMSRNLFETWIDIVSIIEQLPRLNSLKLDGNRFSKFELNDRYSNAHKMLPFSTLQTLSLEDCLLGFIDVVEIARHFSSLQTLSLGGNQLQTLSGGSLPETLTHLSLERNLFESLDQLQPLTKLPTLEHLSLKRNRIHSTSSRASSLDSDSHPITFPSTLHHVDLSGNCISSWGFITALPLVFPGMKSLRISSNPLYNAKQNDMKIDQDADTVYMLTVARIGQLETLNYSQITQKNRLDAEAFYLSQIAKELSSYPESKAQEILARHPRFQDLCKIYGQPTVARNHTSTVRPNTLAAHLLPLTFDLSYEVAKETSTPTTWNTDIPDSFSIYNILGVVARHFGLTASHLKLVWETDEEDIVPFDFAQIDDIDVYVDEHDHNGPAEPPKQNFREEKLEPKTRMIGSWIDGKPAKIRIEWDEEERKRHIDMAKRIAEFTGWS